MSKFTEIKKKVANGEYEVKDNVSELQKIKDKVNSGAYTVDVTGDDISSFLSDSQKYLKRSQNNLKSTTYRNASTLYDFNSDNSSKLRQRASDIRAYLNLNRSSIDEDEYNKLIKYLDDYNKSNESVFKAFEENKAFYEQFENESAYNYFMKYSQMTDKELENAIADYEKQKQGFTDANGGKIKNLIKSSGVFSGLENQVYGGTITKASDVGKNNLNEIENYDREINIIQNEKTRREYDKINQLPYNVKNLLDEYTNLENKEDNHNIDKLLGSVVTAASGGISGGTDLQLGRREEIEKELESLGYDDWKTLADYNRKRVNAKTAEYQNEQIEKAATDAPILTSAGSVIMSPAKVLGGVELLKNATSDTNVPVDGNSPYYNSNRFVNNTRDTVMKNYDWNSKIDNKDWFDDLYSTVMSTGDSLIASAFSGGSAAVAGSIIGMQAASDTAADVASDGGTKEQALLTGVLAGINETLWETVSFGQFNALKEKGISNIFSSKGVKSLVGNLLKSAGVNATEEFNTEIANILVDYCLNDGVSGYQQAYNTYRTNGLTNDEARAKASTDMAKQALNAGFGGALQGLLMGSAGSAIAATEQKATENSIGRYFKDESAKKELLKNAENMGIDISQFNTDTVRGLGKLSRAMSEKDTEITESVNNAVGEAYKTSFREALIDYGESETNADYMADTIHRVVIKGEKATKSENQAMNNSEAAQSVIYDLFENQNSELMKTLIERTDEAAERTYNSVTKINKTVNESAETVNESAETVNESAETVNESAETVNESAENEVTDNDVAAIYKNVGEAFVTANDAQTSAKGFAEVNENGDAVVKLIGDDTAPLSEVVFNYAPAAEGYRFAAEMGNTDKANVALNYYDKAFDGKNIDDFREVFNNYYDAGLKGIGAFSDVDDYFANNYSSTDTVQKLRRLEIFNAGRNIREFKPGVTKLYTAQLTRTGQAQSDVLDTLGKKYGLSFILTDTLTEDGASINGLQIGGTNRVVIALDAEGSLYLRTAGHECFHFIEEWNEKAATELTNFVVDFLKKSNKYDYSARVKQYARLYNFDAKKDIEKIHSEMAADSMFDVFSNEDFVKKLTEENKTLAEKIRDFFKDFIKQLRSMISSMAHTNPEMKALSEHADVCEEIYNKFTSALDEAKNKFAETKNNDVESANMKRSIVEFVDGRKFVKADRQAIFGNDSSKWAGQIINYINKTIRNGKDVTIYSDDGDILSITKDTAGKASVRNTIETAKGLYRPMTDEEYSAKLRAEAHIDEISQISKRGKNNFVDTKKHKFAKDGFNYRTAYFQDANGEYYKLTISVGYNGQIKTIYNIGKIKKTSMPSVAQRPVGIVSAGGNSSNTNVPQSGAGVNTNSMQKGKKNTNRKSIKQSALDSEYLELAKNPEANSDKLQAMVDEAARNADYTIEAWHGTGAITEALPLKTLSENEEVEYKAKFDSLSQNYDELFKKYISINKSVEDKAKLLFPNSTMAQWEYISNNEDRTKALNDRKESYRLLQDLMDEYGQIKKEVKITPNFTVFDISKSKDVGSHFAADEKVSKKISGNEGKLYHVYLKGTNIIETIDIFGRAEIIGDVPYHLYDAGIITEKQYDSLSPIAEKLKEKYEQMDDEKDFGQRYDYISFWKRLNKMLQKKKEFVIKYDNEVEGGGYSYAVFSPNDVKSADPVTYDESGNVIPLSERFNDKSNDIRFSKKQSADTDAVIKENKVLRELLENSQQQMKLTHGFIPEGKTTRVTARELIKEFDSTINMDEVVSDINEVYVAYSSMTDSEAYKYVYKLVYNLADKLINTSKTLDELNQIKADETIKLKSFFKNRHYKITGNLKNELIYNYGSYKEFYNKMFAKRIYFSADADNTLDSSWDEICREFPEYFDPDTTELDQPQAILDAFAANEVTYGLTDEWEYNSAVEAAATKILGKLTELSQNKTLRDKIEERHYFELMKLKEENQKKVKTIQEDYYKKLEQAKTNIRGDYQRRKINIEDSHNKKVAMIMSEYNARAKRNSDGRKSTEMRNKIKKQTLRLSNMLANGTKTRHIPIELIDTVRDLCYAVTFDSRAQSELGSNLNKFEQNYDALKGSDNSIENNAYDDYVSGLVHLLNKRLAGRTVESLSLEDLTAVNETVRAVAQRVSNTNKLFAEGRNETVEGTANTISSEFRSPKAERDFGKLNEIYDFAKKNGWKFLKPIYAFKLIDSDTFTAMYEELRHGEDMWALDMQKARAKQLECAEKYHKSEWKLDEKITVKLKSGDEYKFTVQQIMMFYAAMQREQYVPHLIEGGFVFEDAYKMVENAINGKNGKPKVRQQRQRDAGTHKLYQEDLGILAELLTEDQRAYVNEMRDYLSIDLAEDGNSVTRKLYDINKFVEKKYFPIKSAREFLDGAVKEPDHKSVLSSSMTKELVEKAHNPILLRDFDTMWAEHVQEMAMFHSFALPLDDFRRVYDFRVKITEGSMATSLKEALETSNGKGATGYIDQLIKDINGGVRASSGAAITNKFISLFKKGAVFASASVAIQQPSAIGRATLLIDQKYFLQSIATKRDYEMVMKYAPIAIVKSMGFFDTSVGQNTVDWLTKGTYDSFKSKAEAFFKDGSYRDEVLSKTPEIMDELTWCHIFNACVAEQKEKTKLSGEELYKAAGKRFTEVIEKTQVYDSVFARSELMRSKDSGVKMATAFMAEPTTSLNILIDAAVQAKRGDKKYAGRAVGAFMLSVVINSLLKSLVTAPRDDDDKKTLLEKYIGAFSSNFASDINPVNLIPYIKDINSIFSGYNVERSDMSVIQNLYDSVKKLSSDNATTYTKIENFAGSVAAFFGLPVKNVMRDIRGTVSTVSGIFGIGDTPSLGDTSAEGIKYSLEDNFSDDWILKNFFKATSKTDKLYEAITDKNYNLYDRLIKDYKSTSAVNTAICTALVDNDPRITEAAQAKLDKKPLVYGSYVKTVCADGFSEQNVVAAINRVYNKLKDEAETSDTADSENEAEKKSIYSYTDLNNAIEVGDDAKIIIDDMIEIKVANGKTEAEAKKAIASEVTSYWKPIYIAATSHERSNIVEMLDDTGLYEDIDETAETWEFYDLKDKYLAAKSDSERESIKNKIWNLGHYKSQKTMERAIEKWEKPDK